MEPLTMAWMFDSRWLCQLNNPFHEFLLVVPIAVNLATIVGILLERQALTIQVTHTLFILLTLYALLSLLSLYVLMQAAIAAHTQMEEVTANQEAIRSFVHHFETKRSIWSWKGMLLVLLSMGQVVANALYISQFSTRSNCLTNIIRFWLDTACWGYLCLIVVLFVVCKLTFLLVSWKYPEFYLRHKEVL